MNIENYEFDFDLSTIKNMDRIADFSFNFVVTEKNFRTLFYETKAILEYVKEKNIGFGISMIGNGIFVSYTFCLKEDVILIETYELTNYEDIKTAYDNL
jgi:hypothetical protein